MAMSTITELTIDNNVGILDDLVLPTLHIPDTIELTEHYLDKFLTPPTLSPGVVHQYKY